MGLAVDTVGAFVTNPGATITACTVSPGDSFTVRNFAPTDRAIIEELIRQGATAGVMRVRSPLLHDNVRGVMFTTSDSPSRFLLPPDTGQPVVALDNLIVEASGGAAETELALMVIYYTNLLGTAARLHSWGDIQPLVKNIKPLVVAVTNSATIGTWTDTVITTTENLLHAQSDYAVLGYVTDTALGAVGVKGQDTGNLRVCGVGSTDPSDTSDFYVRKSLREGRPWIPVINAANRFATFVSTIASTASVTANIQLILAELSSTVTP